MPTFNKMRDQLGRAINLSLLNDCEVRAEIEAGNIREVIAEIEEMYDGEMQVASSKNNDGSFFLWGWHSITPKGKIDWRLNVYLLPEGDE